MVLFPYTFYQSFEFSVHRCDSRQTSGIINMEALQNRGMKITWTRLSRLQRFLKTAQSFSYCSLHLWTPPRSFCRRQKIWCPRTWNLNYTITPCFKSPLRDTKLFNQVNFAIFDDGEIEGIKKGTSWLSNAQTASLVLQTNSRSLWTKHLMHGRKWRYLG